MVLNRIVIEDLPILREQLVSKRYINDVKTTANSIIYKKGRIHTYGKSMISGYEVIDVLCAVRKPSIIPLVKKIRGMFHNS